jgi:hypothetical protein
MITPDDYSTLADWFPIIRHARSVAKQSSGLAVLTIRVVVDSLGKPAGLWIMPELTRLVPRATADLALKEIIEQLTEG